MLTQQSLCNRFDAHGSTALIMTGRWCVNVLWNRNLFNDINMHVEYMCLFFILLLRCAALESNDLASIIW